MTLIEDRVIGQIHLRGRENVGKYSEYGMCS